MVTSSRLGSERPQGREGMNVGESLVEHASLERDTFVE